VWNPSGIGFTDFDMDDSSIFVAIRDAAGTRSSYDVGEEPSKMRAKFRRREALRSNEWIKAP